MGPMGTTIEAESVEEDYAALARAQVAIFELGAGRAYTVDKMDERRAVEGRGSHTSRPSELACNTLRHEGMSV
jgi:uncharacterized protein YqgV (UPF0045/DUF77 family)